MTKVNFGGKLELSSKDFHLIQNSKYAALYYKPKNILRTIFINKISFQRKEKWH